jgi:hypothetical protein
MSEVKLDDIKDHLRKAESAAEGMFFATPEARESYRKIFLLAIDAVIYDAGFNVDLVKVVMEQAQVESSSSPERGGGFPESQTPGSQTPGSQTLVVSTMVWVGAKGSEVRFRKDLEFAALPQEGQSVYIAVLNCPAVVEKVSWSSYRDGVVRPRVDLRVLAGEKESVDRPGHRLVEEAYNVAWLKKDGWV